MLAALADTEASRPRPALAARRLETLLALFKAAGVARARLVETPPLAERPDTTGGTIDLNVLEPDAPRRSQLLQTLRGLGGTVVGE